MNNHTHKTFDIGDKTFDVSDFDDGEIETVAEVVTRLAGRMLTIADSVNPDFDPVPPTDVDTPGIRRLRHVWSALEATYGSELVEALWLYDPFNVYILADD
jgi:hypothetical protein